VIDFTGVKVLEGTQARLKCVSSTQDDVLWAYHNTSTGDMHDVYSHGLVVDGYRGRYWKTISPDDGVHLMIIPRVESRDAGLYCCVEQDGVGQEHLVLLSVVANPGESNVQVDKSISLANMFNYSTTF